jgi:hypothetical protein
MRKLLVTLIGALAIGSLAWANPDGTGVKGSTHDVAMTVVSVDVANKSFTGRTEDGTVHTEMVEGDAVGALGGLKAGDKVTATCRDDATGKHVAVTAIRPAGMPKK